MITSWSVDRDFRQRKMAKRGFCCEQTLVCVCLRPLATSTGFLLTFSKVLVVFHNQSKPFGSTEAVQELPGWKEQRVPALVWTSAVPK